jgi:hypothetical protein
MAQLGKLYTTTNLKGEGVFFFFYFFINFFKGKKKTVGQYVIQKDSILELYLFSLLYHRAHEG